MESEQKLSVVKRCEKQGELVMVKKNISLVNFFGFKCPETLKQKIQGLQILFQFSSCF